MADCTRRIIAPSLLAADWGRLTEEVTRAIRAGADWLHCDIMDGHFVDNISFGPNFVATVHRSNDIFLDVHLMLARPDHYVPRFVKAGADNITVHVEADHDISQTLREIRAAGCTCGLAVNPETDFSAAEPWLDQIDLFLVMTVSPGYGGQPFMEDMMEKVRAAKRHREAHGLSYHIEVDGGIYANTAAISAEAGANVFVAGTGLFGEADMGAMVQKFREL